MPCRLARRSWFGRADVAVVDELRSEPQHPERDRDLQMRNGDGADADLGAVRATRGVTRIDGISVEVARDGRAERVVAVEARAGVDVELRALPRPERGAALRADVPADAVPLFTGIERVDAVPRSVAARRPAVVRSQASTRFRSARTRRRSSPSRRVVLRVSSRCARLGVIQRHRWDVDRCAPARQTCSALHGPPSASAAGATHARRW